MIRFFENKISAELKNVGTLIVGNGFALVIPVLVSPIISRIYSATDFGVFTIYLAIVSLISSFATGRFDFAILLSKSKNNSQHLFKISIFLSFVISATVLLIIFNTKEDILHLLNAQNMGNLIFLIPLNIFFFTVIQATQNSLNREKKYKAISTSKSIRSLLVGASQLIFGALGYVSGGLILGKLLGDLFSSTYLGKKINDIKDYIRLSFSSKRARYLVVKYQKFIKINAPHAFLNTLSMSSNAIILGYFFGEKIVGLYGLSYMVCISPVQLVGSAFYQVFSQKASEMFNNNVSIKHYTKKTVRQLALISSVPFLFLILFGPDLFDFIFGSKWYTSGEFVQILGPYLFLVFLISPITYIPLIFNEHQKSFYFEIALFVVKIIGLVMGAKAGSVYLSLILFSSFSIIVQFTNLVWIISLTKRKV